MLAENFKEILSNYELEKTKKFNNNPLVFKIRCDIPKNISRLLCGDFIVKGACGVSSWPKNPWITIIHTSFDSPHEALIIQYNFDTKLKTISLSIIPRVRNKDEYSLIKENLTEYLTDIKLKIKNDSILYKTYNFEDINDITLKNDLDDLIQIYLHLSEIFKNSLIKNDENIKRYKISKIKDIKSINKSESIYSKNINNIEEFFSENNIKKIIKSDISSDDYIQVLNNIKNSSNDSLTELISMYNINLDELTVKDKILLYSKSFTATEYKSIGQLLGSYSFNKILVDDRLANPLIITSIIHELSHFLLEKILKELLMKILDSNDTPLISSFVKITLENDLNYLFDEYCAHSVEGRFSLYGFQDYSSFEFKLDEISNQYSKEDIDYALIIGNTFAYDIKGILESFINDDLRENIKEEFLKLNESPNYKPLKREITQKFNGQDFLDSIAIVLSSGIAECLNQENKLVRYMNKFEDF